MWIVDDKDSKYVLFDSKLMTNFKIPRQFNLRFQPSPRKVFYSYNLVD